MPDDAHAGRVEAAGRGQVPSVTGFDPLAYWAANDEALRDPFSPSCPQMPMGIVMSDELVFDELGVRHDWHRLFHDAEYHAALCRRYNERALQVVGRRLIPEGLSADLDPARPHARTLADVFEARSEWREQSWSYWLHPAAGTEAELEALLDRVERRLEHLREFVFPGGSPARLIPPYRHQRGPVTFAMSVYGVESFLYLMLDNPDLAARFRDLIARAILERARVIDELRAEAGAGSAPRGWSWADDNCALLTPEMYRFFGAPILQAVFARYAPDPGDRRYQHSDSAMGHLLPILGPLGLTEVNLGPTLAIADIRAHLPRAVIHGQLAPFVFERNDAEEIVRQTLRDFRASRERRGVVFATAGSVNPGSRLASLRLVMAAIQEHCRY